MSQYEVSTLKKGLMILDALMQEDSMTLSEVMNKFSLNKSTTFRLLYTLELMGYVKKVDNLYRVTNKVGGPTNPFNARLNWLSVPPLSQLSSEVGETVFIGILHGTDIVTTQIVDTANSMSIPSKTNECNLGCDSKIGESAPAHLSALGKVIMAFLNEHDRERLHESLVNQLNLVQKTKNTFIDPHLLKEHLKVIRSQGYAVDNEETEIGLRCIAAPIMYEGEAIAAVAISGPTIRLTKKLDRGLSKRLIQCSHQISKMLE
ncbi:IclR family transcriptional regulator [Terrilactibacillus laevilacticus]|uniref:IclR family transcriptional regulator n=1 Tax=Terrilactibacillus laevilacticus TaxID=1380157 RepID=A0ABW5PMQ8_9BACI|nr:IclR family transcriptional regulator [Terrilactibacillus laevilacticus]